jgi:hypothetical protein
LPSSSRYDISSNPEDAIDPAQFAIHRNGGRDLCSAIELSKIDFGSFISSD